MDDVDGFISIRMILGSSRARSNHQTMCCGQSHGGSTRIITLPIAQQQTLAESRAPPAATKYVKIREDAPIWKRKNNAEMDLDSGIGNRFPDDGNFQRNGVSAKDCWQKQRVAREGGSERASGGKGQKGTPTVVVTKALWKVTGPPQTLSQYKVFMLMIMLMFMFMFMLLRFHLLLFMFTFTPYHVCHLANEYLFIFAKNNVRLSKTQFLNSCFLARKNQ